MIEHDDEEERWSVPDPVHAMWALANNHPAFDEEMNAEVLGALVLLQSGYEDVTPEVVQEFLTDVREAFAGVSLEVARHIVETSR